MTGWVSCKYKDLDQDWREGYRDFIYKKNKITARWRNVWALGGFDKD